MLVSGSFSKMALANPSVAPYGEAADSVLKSLGLREKYINRRVIGQNIAQTFLYVESGNADLGFISASQDIGTLDPLGTSQANFINQSNKTRC